MHTLARMTPGHSMDGLGTGLDAGQDALAALSGFRQDLYVCLTAAGR